MKKLILLIIVEYMFLNKVTGQPILIAANTNPIINENFDRRVAGQQTSPGSAGANQTWNFSALVPGGLILDSTEIPSSTTYGFDFPTSNVCFYRGNSAWLYYQTSSDSLLYLGYESGGGKLSYTDPEKYLSYPFTYNSTFVDNFIGMDASSSPASSIAGTDTVTADAYGTLQLPDGILTNVLRIKMVENIAKTTNGTTVHNINKQYNWYLPGIHQPVLTLYYSNFFSMYNTSYLIKSTVGVNEAREFINGVNVYPNPAKEQTTLEISSTDLPENFKLSLTNILGEKVREILVNSSKTSINLEGLYSGIYFYQVIGATKILNAGKIFVE